MAKRGLLIFLVLALLIPCAFAQEADVPKLSLQLEESALCAGAVLHGTISSDIPAPQAVEVVVSLGEFGAQRVQLSAGETSVSFSLVTGQSSKKQTVACALLAGEGYALSATASKQVTLDITPRFASNLDQYICYLGHETSFLFSCKRPSAISGKMDFELRDETGLVYATKTYNNPSNNLGFKVLIEEAMLGRHDLSVWYDGVCVSDPVYAAIGDMSVKLITTVPTMEQYMAITVDCAYYESQTDAFIALFEEFGIKCTFFMTGEFVRDFTDSARKIFDAGHEVASHSFTHPRLSQITPAALVDQLHRTNNIIERTFGVYPKLLRPPYGDYDKKVNVVSRSEGQDVIMWSIDSHDWDTAYDYNKIYKRVTKDVGPGHIILFHLDGRYSISVLRAALPYYMNELGLQPVTVSELLEIAGIAPYPKPFETK